MKPSEYAKSLGVPSLAWIARETGLTEPTLYNWYKARPAAFRMLCVGAASVHSSQDKLDQIREILDK